MKQNIANHRLAMKMKFILILWIILSVSDIIFQGNVKAITTMNQQTKGQMNNIIMCKEKISKKALMMHEKSYMSLCDVTFCNGLLHNLTIQSL